MRAQRVAFAGSTVKCDRFPPRIRGLEPFSQRFEAFRLAALRCDVLFASYPAGTHIDAHIHGTEEFEFRFTPEGAKS